MGLCLPGVDAPKDLPQRISVPRFSANGRSQLRGNTIAFSLHIRDQEMNKPLNSTMASATKSLLAFSA